MAGPIRIAVLANAAQARRELDGLGRSTTTVGQRFSAMRVAAVAGLAGATYAAGRFAVASVRAASDAEQSIGATETVFGRFAQKVIAVSDRAAERYGLSANSYRESANLIGSLFRNQGVALDQLAGKTDKAIGVASDLAATFGGTTADAVEALSSAFKGEFDPLEKYGISLKQSTVTTKAMAVAGVDTAAAFGKLTLAQQAAAKQQATSALITEQAGNALGAFGRETDTIAHKQQVMGAQFDNIKVKVGNALLPILGDLADLAEQRVVPALEDAASWLEANSGQIEDTATSLGRSLLPPLRTLAELAGGAVRTVAGLPEPLRSFGIEAGIAALAVYKVNGALTATKFSGFLSNLRDAETRTAALGRAARITAGVGGLALLMDGARRTDSALGVLETGLGGVATGFAVGGPFGAAIGGVAGLLFGLQRNVHAANAEFRDGARFQEDYASSLDSVTAAITANTRETALNNLRKRNLLDIGHAIGLSDRTLTSAALGQAGAMARVTERVHSLTAGVHGLDGSQAFFNRGSARGFLQAMGQQHRALTAERRAALETLPATAPYGGALKRLPKRVASEIRADGILKTTKGVADLAHRYNLTPKQVKTLIDVVHADVSLKRVLGVQKALRDTDKIKPSLGNYTLGVGREMEAASKIGRDGTEHLSTALKTGTAKARADLAAFKASVTSGVAAARSTASQEAPSVGAALQSGVLSGFSGTARLLAANAASAVRAAIVAARIAAKIKSPSREMHYIGAMLGRGLTDGLDGKRRAAGDSAAALVKALLSRVTRGLSGVQDATAKVGDYITSTLADQERRIEAGIKARFKGKEEATRLRAAERAWKAHSRAVQRAMRDEYDALTRNGKAQDANAAALDRARAKLAQLQQQARDYAATIKASFVTFASPVGLGAQEDGTVSTSGLLEQLKDRLVKAQRFAALIRQLRKAKLSKTVIQQLLDAGPEQGLATAEAIAAGGQSAIDQISQLTKGIATEGSKLGGEMSKAYYGAGVRAAQGLVNGLEAKAAQLDRIAERLARKLVRKVKDELGIKSPSRVFRGIGDQVTRGLVLGLDETYVSRAGTRLAGALASGFGTPALDAAATITAGGAAGRPTVTVTLTAEQLTALERGRQIRLDLDAYTAAGGLARA